MTTAPAAATRARLSELSDRYRNGVALRRATRIAVVLPLLLVLLQTLPATTDTALFGVFAALVMMLFADFGGPLPIRFLAYLLTTLTAIPLLLAGTTFGQSVEGAAAVMFAVAMVVGVVGVLRGLLASAQVTLLLATVLAVTSTEPGSQFPVVLSWTIGGLTAACASLLLWPARPSRELSKDLARLYRTAAATVRARWAQPDRERLNQLLQEYDAGLADLHGQFDGNLLRPAGLTDHDRRLAQLVDLISRLRAYQKWQDVTAADAAPQPQLHAMNQDLGALVADELAAISDEVLHHRHTVSPERIRVARDAHLTAITRWSAEQREQLSGAELRRHLDDVFPLRLTSISTELASASADDQSGFGDPLLGPQLQHDQSGIAARLRRHLTWESPWFRNALRTAVALTISVALAKSLGLGHAFWIVLGTLTALGFDALGTGRTAIQALTGTFAGVVIGAGLILVIGDNPAVWWALLPLVLLIAGYTPGTFSLGVGQAGFSVTVIVLFSLLTTATLETAELRIEDVTIGLVVSLLISAVMWPRGVAATLHTRMREAMNAAGNHLLMAIDYTAGGAVDRELLAEFATRCEGALDRAQEAYDLSVAQKPPDSIPMQRWFRVSLAARHVDIAARLLPGIVLAVNDRGGDRTIPVQLAGPLLATTHDVREHLRSLVDAWDEPDDDPTAVVHLPTDTSQVPLPASIVALRRAIDDWLQTPSDWTAATPDPTPAVVTWTADWTAFIAWNAQILEQVLRAPPAAPSPR